MIFCMMLLSVFAYSTSIGLYGTGIDTSQDIYNRLSNNGDLWSILDSHMDDRRLRVPELYAWDDARDGKIRILKRQDTNYGRYLYNQVKG